MKFDWHAVQREQLPAILLDFDVPRESIPSRSSPADFQDVVLGFVSEASRARPQALAVVLLGAKRRDFFAWISTYIEEIFPLSQFCRVLGADDWSMIDVEESTAINFGSINPVWASLVVGEMLGQGGLDTPLAAMPLSRAAGCLSFAVARAALLHPHRPDVRSRCSERLAIAEREPRFARRNITTEMLRGAWSVASSFNSVGRGVPYAEFATEILGLVGALDPQSRKLLETTSELFNDSAEARVRGFDSVVDRMSLLVPKVRSPQESTAATLAAAAFLAGRGTSHIELLEPASHVLPEVLVWYGLFAGVVGPRYWDKAWTQQAKGVERGLRQSFRIDEPILGDICWIEYEWLARTYDSAETFSRFPRAFPSGVAIEVVPGAVCQFRLGEHVGISRSRVETRMAGPATADVGPSPSAEAVARVLQMLSDAVDLLSKSTSSQPGLFESEIVSTKSRRGKGASASGRKDVGKGS